MSHVRPAAAAIGIAVLVAGCASAANDGPAFNVGQERAKVVLDNWATAVKSWGGNPSVVVLGDLTGQDGAWEEANGENKVSLMAGDVLSERDLAPSHPATAIVAWPDGTTATVPVQDAQAAIVAIGQSAAPDAACKECQPLIATAATLTTAPIQTTRGPATGPVWSFTIRGTSVRVTRVAIAAPVVAAPMPESNGSVVAIDAASSRVGATSMTVRFVGVPNPGSEACGEDYTADAYESDIAVTVLVWRHPHVSLLPGGCTSVGAFRTADAVLSKLLGDRPVLDPATGQPVTLTLAP